MALVQWDNTHDLSLLQGDMNRLFERFFGPATSTTRPARDRWAPAMDVVEEGDTFVLRADLPGVDRDDVTIDVQDRTLTISGERSHALQPEHDGGYVRLERAFGRFERTLTLPRGVDLDAIDASFDRGVLELRIPKPAEARPRRIEIRDAAPGEIEAHATSD